MLSRKELTAKRKLALAEKLKVGAFVKNVWGCTMRRVEYYEVVSIVKNRVGLRRANISGDPSPNCASSVVTLIGPNPNAVERVYATTRMGYLLKEGKSLKDHWSTYQFVEIGDKTSTWSD